MTKILLVEDDKSLREIYGVRLIAEGYEIISAGDGEEALAMAIKERPNLIVSDVMMPKISGFDMLDILRSTTETKDVKVIMMTALSSDDQRARGEALGADRYLVKSQVGIEDVVRTVHEVLGDGVAVQQPSPEAFTSPVPAPQVAVAETPEISAPAPFSAPEPAFAAPQPDQFAAPEPVAPIDPEPSPEPQFIPPTPVAPSFPSMINTPPEVPPAQQFSPAPAPQPFQSAPNPLPQPTAPFSSNRPGSLGDRIVTPLSDPTPPANIASLMSQELNSVDSAPVAPQSFGSSSDSQTPPSTPQV